MTQARAGQGDVMMTDQGADGTGAYSADFLGDDFDNDVIQDMERYFFLLLVFQFHFFFFALLIA